MFFPTRPAALMLALLLITTLACKAQEQVFATPTPAQFPNSSTLTPAPVETLAPTSAPTAILTVAQAQPTLAEIILAPSPEITRAPACTAYPQTSAILAGTSAEQWLEWVRKLSGAEPVTIGGETVTITTRFSPAMFNGSPNARAFDFVLETVKGWYPAQQIEVMEYQVQSQAGNFFTWKNLVLTLPGASKADERVLLTAHLDSVSEDDPFQSAPGAEDNASGSAALLEAARLLREYKFARTIQIIWFTGEEEGLLGSRAFANHLPQDARIIGDVNLDMFGYDSDQDGCFEIHAGELPQSDAVGQCFAAQARAFGLRRFDYLTAGAEEGSDHSSFWDIQVGAIEILENMTDQGQPGGCRQADPNPFYHTPGDTVDQINAQSGFAIVRVALATVAALAGQ